jgi:chaperonin cofactor prefoldin
MVRSEIRQSEGVYSTSTNNLEKAYEDLEREIIEIKQRLQNSVGSNVPNQRFHASLREPQTQTRLRSGQMDRDTELAQSIGSNLVGPGSASASRR